MINLSEAKIKARKTLDEKIGTCTGAYMLTLIQICFASVVIPVFGVLLGNPAATLGYSGYNLNVSKGENPKAADVFKGYDNSIRALGCAVLIYISLFLWSLTGGVVVFLGSLIYLFSDVQALGIILMILGSLWALFIRIYKHYQYIYSFTVLVENEEYKAVECINKSIEITAGHLLDLFVCDLSFIGWMLLTALLFALPGLYVFPYYNLTYAYIYLEITEYSKSAGSFTGSSGKAEIIGIYGQYKGYSIPANNNEEIVIGRNAAESSIVLDQNAEKISKKHCGIIYDKNSNSYMVIDYSSNGTYLADGSRLARNIRTSLPRGTSIYLGDKINVFKLM